MQQQWFIPVEQQHIMLDDYNGQELQNDDPVQNGQHLFIAFQDDAI